MTKTPSDGNILGITLTGNQKMDLLSEIEYFLVKKDKRGSRSASVFGRFIPGKLFITTPNPEQMVIASQDPKFKKILLASDVRLCDGVGLAAWSKFLNLPKTNVQVLKPIFYLLQGLYIEMSIIFNRNMLEKHQTVIKGREMFLDLLRLANKHQWKIFLLGGRKSVNEKAVSVLTKKYKKIIFQEESGPLLNVNGVPLNGEELRVDQIAVQKINKFKPDLLFVGFGAPKQEKWVYQRLAKLNISGTMVIGGTLDQIAGTRLNVPSLINNFGLEWLWRLFTGSQNLERIYNAVIRFPILVYQEKLRMNLVRGFEN